MISMLGVFTNKSLYSKNIGETWQPKSSGLRVGRDVGAISYSSTQSPGSRNVVVADGDDVKYNSTAIFNLAKSAAQQGFQLKNFRRASIEDAMQGKLSAVLNDTDQPLSRVEKGNYMVSYSSGSGSLNVYEKVKNEQGKDGWKLIDSRDVTADTKVGWSEEGEPSILTGGAALSTDARGRDVLRAEGDNEMIIRMSNVNVEAGNRTVIFNLGGAGEFSGGSGATFLGSYGGDTVIRGGEGDNTYAGYFDRVAFEAAENGRGTYSGVFEGVTIEGGNAGNVFSGYFGKSASGDGGEPARASVINGGSGENKFGGLFLDGSQVNGGEGSDRFHGRFIDSLVNGGAGNDSFGSNINLNQLKKIFSDEGVDENGNQRASRAYMGLESDFIGGEVEAGEGEDSFNSVAYGSVIRMGAGDDRLGGVFTDTQVHGGGGDDNLAAMYSRGAIFETGAGDDKINLATAVSSSVVAGEGANNIILGRNMDKGTGKRGMAETDGEDRHSNGTTWMTKQESFQKYARGDEYGELHGNTVDASSGENAVRVNDGNGTVRVLSGDLYEEGETLESASAFSESASAAGAGVTAGTPDAGLELTSQAARNNQSLLEAALNSESVDARREKARKAIGRYAVQSGDSPRAEGPSAAVINTGAGDSIEVDGAERLLGREPQQENKSWIHQMVRRQSGPGQSYGMNFMSFK